MDHNYIQCSLVEIPEYFVSASGKSRRFGRYLSTSYWDVQGYGSKKWAVAAYIDCDLEAHADLSDDEVAQRCVNYLNKPPKRKKYAKKDPKPKFGILELYKSKVINKMGKQLISAIFIVSARKNRMFWGKGRNV